MKAITIPYYRVHAFTDEMEGGNPAGVCLLENWLSDERMQQIAWQNALSETAFLVGGNGHYHLRWFTPGCEVDLCGHATLASTFVLARHTEDQQAEYHFDTLSGPIHVRVVKPWFVLNMPAQQVVPLSLPTGLESALGARPTAAFKAPDDTVLLFDNEKIVREMKPDFQLLQQSDHRGVIVTARAEETGIDFVSRWFGGADVGIDEDPVTGSAHRTLAPFWSQRLGKKQFTARQVSARGGFLTCEVKNDRVEVSGQAVLYQSGLLHL